MTDDTSRRARDLIESEAETARRGPDEQPAMGPELPPRVRLHRAELVGMSVVALVPLLALAGLVGPGTARVEGASAALGLEVRHPTRYRHGMVETLEARVTNRTAAPMGRVALSFDDAYLGAFAVTMAAPALARPYVVELTALAPGETRTVVVDLQADEAGRHRGRAVAAHAGDSVVVALSTLVLP